MPRIGQKVIVDFLNGDLDYPIVVGRVHNADEMHAWQLPEQKHLAGLRSRSVIPLDSARITHLYELRWLLEPAALQSAGAHIPREEMETITDHLHSAMRDYAHVTRETLDQLEHDLHVRLLSYCPNTDLLQSLQRTRSVLMLSKHVLGFSAPMPPSQDQFLAEHRDILRAMTAGDVSNAAQHLREHLQASCAKVALRAEQVRAGYTKPMLSYVTER